MLLAAVTLPLCAAFAYLGGNWTGSWVKFALIFTGVAIFPYRPSLSVPHLVKRLALPLSAVSYHIYLFHRILPELFLPQPEP